MNPIKKISQNFFLHIHATKVNMHSLRPLYTLGLGVISISLFIILIITGGLLLVHYTPTVDQAYASVKEIIFIVPGGQLLRNLHHWAGHALIVTTFLHLLRVFYTSSYTNGRTQNWVFGVIMFVIIIAAGFSGYLLPWDQLAYWAVTIGTNIAASFRELTDALHITGWLDIGGFFKHLLIGGETVGQPALSRFFTLHVFILPVSLCLFCMLHFWRIRKDGGLSRPANATTETVFAWPTLLWAELALFMLTLAILLCISSVAHAPLRHIANPTLPENPAKSAWFLLGIQELVSHSAFSGGILIPLLFIVFLIAIPFIDRETQYIGHWFAKSTGKRITGQSAFIAAAATISFLFVHIKFGWLRDWIANIPTLAIILINPGTLLCVCFAIWSRYVYQKTQSTRMAVIALFTCAIVSLLLLTIVGTYFRGPNWHFYWHHSLWIHS